MLRLIGFFVLVIVLTNVLGWLPIIGPIYDRLGIFSLWITAILLSVFLSKWGQRAVQVRKDRNVVRELQAVNSPHNSGKLGSLYLAQNRPKKALEHLTAAVAGEPDNADWNYRLGCAQLALRDLDEAIDSLGKAVAIDEEHAYGGAMMRLAEAQTAAGESEPALENLARFERNHGPSPESAFRRGIALKECGRKDEAKAALAEVSQIAAEAARYKKREASVWVARAKMATLF